VTEQPPAGEPGRGQRPGTGPGTGPGPDATTRPAGAEQDAALRSTGAGAGPGAEAGAGAEDRLAETHGRGDHQSAAGEALLRADEVVAGYVAGVNILNGCDFYVNDGELVGIIGPNGAGKSTLLKAIFGLVGVRSGRITLRGEDITGLKANRLVAKGVGFVPQTENVFPSLTIEENLQMGVYQSPKKFKQSFEFVTGLFPALADRRAQRAGSLSGGERQMVAMGRALMMEPSVLLLDEPSAGLSPALQDEVFVRTRQINRAGVSVIMVEQNARRCLQICDRGYVLDQGRNAYTASGKDLIHDPKVIELYLGTLARA
jgi:branched-chain amino acid transport system ATP-binding protein